MAAPSVTDILPGASWLFWAPATVVWDLEAYLLLKNDVPVGLYLRKADAMAAVDAATPQSLRGLSELETEARGHFLVTPTTIQLAVIVREPGDTERYQVYQVGDPIGCSSDETLRRRAWGKLDQIRITDEEWAALGGKPKR